MLSQKILDAAALVPPTCTIITTNANERLQR
jgi:hypothetical protein